MRIQCFAVHPAGVCLLAFAIVAATSLVIGPPAQAAAQWSQPVIVYQGSGYTSDPVLVSDPSGDVHLLFMEAGRRLNDVSTPGAIMYTRLHQGTWSQPTDVLVTPEGGAADAPAAAVDGFGYLHVLWRSGSFGDIYYSHAHVSDAGSARAWSSPMKVSETGASAGSFGDTVAAIAVSPDALHVVYADIKGVVSYRRSSDGGQSWSTPTTLSDNSTKTGADDPQVAADGRGDVYVTWSEFKQPDGWPPIGVFYAVSHDAGKSWSTPLRVASDNRGLITVATDGAQHVYRAWSTIADIGEHGGQWSGDGGQTWSAPQLIVPALKGGLAGFTAMAYDSAGVLHMVVASDFAGLNPGIYAIAWNGISWTQPVRVSQGAIGKKSIEMPAMTVSNGNRINVAFEDDFTRIWYTSQVGDAPLLQSEPVPTPPVLAAPTSLVPKPVPVSELRGLVVRPTPTPRPTLPDTDSGVADSGVQTSSGPLLPLMAGVTSTLVLVGLLAFVRARRLS